MTVTESFYWDLNDATRGFAIVSPSALTIECRQLNQAGVYSRCSAYLHAVKAANTIEGEKVVAELRRAPIDDKLFGTIVVRPDGRAVHAMHVFRVKAPAASHDRWDVYRQAGGYPGRPGVPSARPGRLPAGGGIRETVAAQLHARTPSWPDSIRPSRAAPDCRVNHRVFARWRWPPGNDVLWCSSQPRTALIRALRFGLGLPRFRGLLRRRSSCADCSGDPARFGLI